MGPVRYLANHAKSLIHNLDTNSVEQFNSIICKHIGGKRINYCWSRSFQGRCHAAVISWNKKSTVSLVSKSLTGYSPSIVTKRVEQRNIQHQRLKKRIIPRKLFISKESKDYGKQCQKPDLSAEDYKIAAGIYIAENYTKPKEEIETLQCLTKDQSDSSLWINERKKRITASKFGDVCTKKITTSRQSLVESIIFPYNFYHPAIEYGKKYEKNALKELENELKTTIKECGLFIDKDLQYLGATPDGILEDNSAIIEIKCPYSARILTPEEGIEKRKITFWKKNGTVNTRHKWYFQIQGQMHITQIGTCIFMVWTPKGHKIEIIFKDDSFWESQMKINLIRFFEDCLLPELVDSRKERGMEIRDPAYVDVEKNKKRKRCTTYICKT